jgi:DNA-directed RNA polymerase subunit RPC12/RpoP
MVEEHAKASYKHQVLHAVNMPFNDIGKQTLYAEMTKMTFEQQGELVAKLQENYFCIECLNKGKGLQSNETDLESDELVCPKCGLVESATKGFGQREAQKEQSQKKRRRAKHAIGLTREDRKTLRQLKSRNERKESYHNLAPMVCCRALVRFCLTILSAFYTLFSSFLNDYWFGDRHVLC